VKFENPEIRDGVNVTSAKPLVDFLSIALSIIVLAGLLTLALYLTAGWLAKRVPFAAETRVAARFFPEAADPTGREEALRALGVRLLPHLGLPPGLTVHIHYRDEPTINAFATLGGNIVMYRGLIDRLEHENALAMVLAHEIAHVKHRDPVVGAGRGIALAVVVSAVSAGAGDIVSGNVFGGASMVTALRFGREQETAADEAALAAVAKLYGHVNGAADLFKALQAEGARRDRKAPPEFLATHPLTQTRIDRIDAIASERGWATDGPLTPLAPALARKAQAGDEKPKE
jgi:beta-barrel assembly-enhancing protease